LDSGKAAGRSIFFLFEDNFCIYPAQFIEPALWVEI